MPGTVSAMSVFIFGFAGSLLLLQLFASWGDGGLLFLAVPGLLLGVASQVAEHRLWSTWT